MKNPSRVPKHTAHLIVHLSRSGAVTGWGIYNCEPGGLTTHGGIVYAELMRVAGKSYADARVNLLATLIGPQGRYPSFVEFWGLPQ